MEITVCERDFEVWYIALAHRLAWCFADCESERDLKERDEEIEEGSRRWVKRERQRHR